MGDYRHYIIHFIFENGITYAFVFDTAVTGFDLSDLLTATMLDAELLKEINIMDGNGNTAGGDFVIKVKAGNASADYNDANPDMMIALISASAAADATFGVVFLLTNPSRDLC